MSLQGAVAELDKTIAELNNLNPAHSVGQSGLGIAV
jgi:hypothetical protein